MLSILVVKRRSFRVPGPLRHRSCTDDEHDVVEYDKWRECAEPSYLNVAGVNVFRVEGIYPDRAAEHVGIDPQVCQIVAVIARFRWRRDTASPAALEAGAA